MSEKALKFGNAIVNKKEFHAFKKSIPLNLADTDKIVIFDRFKYSDHGSNNTLQATKQTISLDPYVLFYPK